MTRSSYRFVAIAPWPRGEQEKHVGVDELSFLNLGSVFVGSVGVCGIFLESQHSHIAVFEANC